MSTQEIKPPGRPILDNILVLPDEPDKETEEGILLPEGSTVARRFQGTVVAWGEEVEEKYPEIRKGTRLLWLYPLSSTIECGDRTYVLLTPYDVALILED